MRETKSERERARYRGLHLGITSVTIPGSPLDDDVQRSLEGGPVLASLARFALAESIFAFALSVLSCNHDASGTPIYNALP